jgi:serine/threonine-protein kinase
VDTTVTDALVGRLLDGRYRVVRRIARGGMAVVYEALDTRLDRPVALKVMHPWLAEDAGFVSKFIHEARSAARLSHPNVVAVYDQGADDGTVFLAMEYVAGRTLRDLLRERTRLTPREALDLLEPVLSALAAAHRAGLVHRDIKPENVLLADDGRVKVADFGLARAAAAAQTGQTTHGLLMGTVAYLAPELASGQADERSDVYSAGIMLFEMLTGVPPFTAEDVMGVVYRHVHEDVPPPSSVVPSIAGPLDALVREATDRDPSRRPADAAALLEQVELTRRQLSPAQLGASGHTIDLTETLIVPIPGTPAVAAAVPAPVGPPGQIPRAALGSKRRRPVVVGLLLLLLVTAVVGYGAWWLGSGRYTAMPSVLGLTGAAATSKLQADGLSAKLGSPVFSETVKAGLVVDTRPAPSEQVRKGSTVTLIISSGPERYAVPSLSGMTPDQAAAALAAVNLVVGTQSSGYSTTIPAGQIMAQDPGVGERVKRDTAVRITVSQGLPPVSVPKLTGVTLDQATTTLKNAKLTIKRGTDAYNQTVPAGSVVSQTPAAGTSVPQGSTVTVVVSKGPPLVPVPSVVGMSTKEATKVLTKAGFTVNINKVLGGFFDTVRMQNPSGGSQAPMGSAITLTIV